MIFAKFSRPTARVTFSDAAVITDFDGQRTLMFRVANMRGNQVVDASMTVMLARFEVTAEGERFRRFYELELMRNKTSMFALTWSAIHVIDEHSPLHNLREEQDWRDGDAEVLVSLSGIDGTLGQTINARHSYTFDEIALGSRLANVIDVREDGILEVDFSRFHDIVSEVSDPLDPAPVRRRR